MAFCRWSFEFGNPSIMRSKRLEKGAKRNEDSKAECWEEKGNDFGNRDQEVVNLESGRGVVKLCSDPAGKRQNQAEHP